MLRSCLSLFSLLCKYYIYLVVVSSSSSSSSSHTLSCRMATASPKEEGKHWCVAPIITSTPPSDSPL